MHATVKYNFYLLHPTSNFLSPLHWWHLSIVQSTLRRLWIVKVMKFYVNCLCWMKPINDGSPQVTHLLISFVLRPSLIMRWILWACTAGSWIRKIITTEDCLNWYLSVWVILVSYLKSKAWGEKGGLKEQHDQVLHLLVSTRCLGFSTEGREFNKAHKYLVRIIGKNNRNVGPNKKPYRCCGLGTFQGASWQPCSPWWRCPSEPEPSWSAPCLPSSHTKSSNILMSAIEQKHAKIPGTFLKFCSKLRTHHFDMEISATSTDKKHHVEQNCDHYVILCHM